MRLNKKIVLTLLAGIIILSSCEKDKPDIGFFDENVLSISTYLKKNKEEYSKFWQIIQDTELYNSLNSYNPHGDGFTLFLPTDDAFDRFIERSEEYSDFESLLADTEFSRLLCRYHIVNRSVLTSEFPYGAFPDSTATGDYLTIGIEVQDDTSYYKVNNTAPLAIRDIETTNGYIQVISEVLEPISFNSYDMLVYLEDYSILAQAFEYSGLKDTMGIYRHNSSGQRIKNDYTVLAEHDSIFHREGIYSFDDLVAKYHSPGFDLDDPEGGLYQFAGYHLLEGRYFLDAIQGESNYNSYALYPVQISAGIDIKINTEVDTFRLEIVGTDTTIINYIGLYYNESNVNTKNGPIHFIDEVMELYQPSRSDKTFQFLEDPKIKESEKTDGTYEFVDKNLFELIWWNGPEKLTYVKGSTNSNTADNLDYIELDESFQFEYTMPKIMPGKYTLNLRAEAYGGNSATIRVWIDGKRLGGNFDLKGGSKSEPYKLFPIGIVEFTRYEEHTLKISTLIPGSMKIDYVNFEVE